MNTQQFNTRNIDWVQRNLAGFLKGSNAVAGKHKGQYEHKNATDCEELPQRQARTVAQDQPAEHDQHCGSHQQSGEDHALTLL